MMSSPMPPRAGGSDEEATIDLRQYLALIRHMWWLFVLATLLAGAAAYLYSRQLTPIYQASTTMLINEAPSLTRVTDYNTLITSERLAQTYAQMMTTRAVLEEVATRLGLNLAPDDLSEMVTVTPVRDTQLVDVAVEHADPRTAAAIANALVVVFSEQIYETQTARFSASKQRIQDQIVATEAQMTQTRAQLAAEKDPLVVDRLETRLNQYEQIYANLILSFEEVQLAEAQAVSSVTQVERATPPETPVRPRTMQNTLLAAIVGLMLAAAGVFARDALDDTVRDPVETARRLDLPVMGVIARYPLPADGQPIACAQPRSPVTESFRALRTNVQYASVDDPLRTLLVTSAAPGEGKTTVAANLAVVMAQSGRSVALVDADLHRPCVHKVLSTGLQPGLSSLFIQPRVYLDGAFQPTAQETLHVVAAGPLPPNPAELLGSNRMREILDAVLDQADLAIIDSPPVLSVTDPVVLSTLATGVLIVVRPGVTKMSALYQAVEDLRRVGAHLIGLVFNGIDASSTRYGYYYKNYYYRNYRYQEDDPTGQPEKDKTRPRAISRQ